MSATQSLERLDPVLEHRIRLAVCVLLAQTHEIRFSRFRQVLDATDGNLGAQLRKLEDAKYVSARKTFEKRRPVTWYRLTKTGRLALQRHVQALNQLLGPVALGPNQEA